jgi:D-psicose/D-tagatose/L-ribulose 3-epimerase
MNKIGIHYAYWSSEWEIDLVQQVKNAANVGFSAIDITPPDFIESNDYKSMDELIEVSKETNVELNFCIGFPKSKDMASADPAIRQAGIDYTKRILEAVHYMGGRVLSGILYSSWPYLYDHQLTEKNKSDAWKRGVESIQTIIPEAENRGIVYAIEIVNRFEQYILNSVDEGIQFCQDIGSPSAKLLVDVFHANIEEINIADSIRKAGDLLAHLHISENNRRLPGSGKHIDWDDIFKALKQINYQGNIVMEPFLESFGPVGNDLRIWRDNEKDLSKEARDRYARESIAFVKSKMQN